MSIRLSKKSKGGTSYLIGIVVVIFFIIYFYLILLLLIVIVSTREYMNENALDQHQRKGKAIDWIHALDPVHLGEIQADF